jgi:hypothetical protein
VPPVTAGGTHSTMKTASYEIAELRPVSRKVRPSWSDREQYVWTIEISYELERYLRVIRKWCRLDDLNQAATVLVIHRVAKANEFLKTCSFRNEWSPVFAGFGFAAEYSDENCWQLFNGVASEAASLVRWLEQSKLEPEYIERCKACCQFARFIRNDVVPLARLGLFRGKNGGDYFADVAAAMEETVRRGPWRAISAAG